MKRLTVEEYKSRVPVGNSEYFDSLSKEEQDEYVKQYSVYSELLTDYFIKHFSLKEYDDALVNSPYSFCPVEEDDMDIYQYLASDRLSYLYIRNNLYIERLDDKEKTFLNGLSDCDEVAYNDEVDSFVGGSYKKVISEEKEKCFFGPETYEYLLDGNGLVIAVRYDDYQLLPGQTEDEWFDYNYNRLQDIDMLSELMEMRLSKESGCSTKVAKYNASSTYKRDNASTSTLENEFKPNK